MSDFMSDISALRNTGAGAAANAKESKSSGYDLDMQDFLNLMIVQLQSQTIDDTADTGEMLNQMVQMQMVTALANMTDASLMTYTSSLVGKEVTIGIPKEDGNIEEIVIKVTGSGVYNGNQVIFGDDGKMYQLSQIMAVGRLPAPEETDKGETDEGDAGQNGGAAGTPPVEDKETA